MSDKTLELQIRIAADEAARIVSSLKGQIKELAEESGKYAKNDGEALKQSFKEAEAAAKETTFSINDIKKAIGNLTEVVVATKALSVIKDMGSFALTTADNFQTARNQFGVLLGDMEAGAGLFNQIKEFNDVTPFDLDTLTQATNVLISAKVPLSDLQDQLTKFGDLSQGNSQRMTSYINAFSQAAAKGKADMQVLNTYLNQGVPILDALAKNFNVTTAEVVEMSSKGQISFEAFSQALDDLTAAGGQYFGGMELASKSLASMQEGLNEAVNSLGASFGEMLLPAAIAVVEALTNITNAIDESPLLKGLLAGAIVAVTGYLAAMAVKSGIAFAAQMALNFSIGAVNPVVLASTIAVAALAAGYVAMAANAQSATREMENNTLATRQQISAINDMAGATRMHADSFRNRSGEEIASSIRTLEGRVNQINGQIQQKRDELERTVNRYAEEGRDFLIEATRREFDVEISNMNFALNAARAELNAAREGYQQFRREASAPVEIPVVVDENAIRAAQKWLEQWREQYRRFKAEMSENPFATINLDENIAMAEARMHGASAGIINQINEYYSAERMRIIKELEQEEERSVMALLRTKIDAINLQYREELNALNELEQKRIFAAEITGEDIEEIKKLYDELREALELNLEININQAKLDEARASVKNWQEALSDDLLILLMNLEAFSDQAAVILSELSMQLIELSTNATLSGFEEFGRALAQGEDAAESFNRALTQMAGQILKQLPMMFLQAGLQLISNGQWALGLGFIAAAGSSAIISGYVDGASQHAQGGIFNEYGQVAQAYAAGGAFTNQIVSQPTYFAHGGGFGLMGEAGPEAIMPLTRMPNGDLGVQTSGTGSNVVINIINNAGVKIQQEETENADGGKEIEIIIGEAVNKHLASGKADRVMQSRYGQRAIGV